MGVGCGELTVIANLTSPVILPYKGRMKWRHGIFSHNDFPLYRRGSMGVHLRKHSTLLLSTKRFDSPCRLKPSPCLDFLLASLSRKRERDRG